MAEDAGLGSIGQDDAPALQTGAYAAAIDHRGMLGGGQQFRADRVDPAGVAQRQLVWQAFQPDGVHLAVVLVNQIAGEFDVAVATHPLDVDLLPEEERSVFSVPLLRSMTRISFMVLV